MNRSLPSELIFWFGVISVIIVMLAYYQGLVANAQAVGPFIIQAGALAQGRNPKTFEFSGYPKSS